MIPQVTPEQVKTAEAQAWALLAPYGITPENTSVRSGLQSMSGSKVGLLRYPNWGMSADVTSWRYPTALINPDLPTQMHRMGIRADVTETICETLLHEIMHAAYDWLKEVGDETLCDQAIDTAEFDIDLRHQDWNEALVEQLARHINLRSEAIWAEELLRDYAAQRKHHISTAPEPCVRPYGPLFDAAYQIDDSLYSIATEKTVLLCENLRVRNSEIQWVITRDPLTLSNAWTTWTFQNPDELTDFARNFMEGEDLPKGEPNTLSPAQRGAPVTDHSGLHILQSTAQLIP